MRTISNIAYLMICLCIITGCKRKTFEESLQEEAQKFTETQCPKDIDETCRIDSMVFDIASRTLCYHYSLKGTLNNEEAITDPLIEDFTETMLLHLRSDISLKKHKLSNINFEYHYYFTPSHEEAFFIHFGPKDYNGKMQVKTFNYREVRNLREFTRLNCPMRQDSCTVLDSMWYDSIARTIYYDYTVNGMLDNDTLYDNYIKNAMKAALIDGIKKNQEVKEEREKEKLDFGFRYYSATTKNLLLEQIIKNEEVNK